MAPKKRKKQRVLVLTQEVPLLLTEEVPVNNHMRSFVIATCLALIVIVLVNIRLEFQVKQLAKTDGDPVYRYVWVKPWETKPFLLPKEKPKMPYEEHYDVAPDENTKQFLTVWRIIRFGMQIYN
jgi:hypothetical protein|tara:strand:+ start:3835 stop:4206 length:372 start_codon:yes stop_codon:yes gene_type:complete